MSYVRVTFYYQNKINYTALYFFGAIIRLFRKDWKTNQCVLVSEIMSIESILIITINTVIKIKRRSSFRRTVMDHFLCLEWHFSFGFSCNLGTLA